jgi:hypothetical protein
MVCSQAQAVTLQEKANEGLFYLQIMYCWQDWNHACFQCWSESESWSKYLAVASYCSSHVSLVTSSEAFQLARACTVDKIESMYAVDAGARVSLGRSIYVAVSSYCSSHVSLVTKLAFRRRRRSQSLMWALLSPWAPPPGTLAQFVFSPVTRRVQSWAYFGPLCLFMSRRSRPA